MAKYQQVRKATNFSGDVVYTMQLNPDESIDLRYTEPQTSDVLDAECDEYLENKKKKRRSRSCYSKSYRTSLYDKRREDERWLVLFT